MKKLFYFSVFSIFLVIVSACTPSTPTVTEIIPPPVTKTIPPTPTERISPTETPVATISFVSPQDGATIDVAGMTFQINPVPGAEGYAWIFIQNGITLWDTIKNEQRLSDAEYRLPETGNPNDLFVSGELQVQVKARIGGVWTEPATITLYLLPQKTPEPTSTPTPIPTATLPPLATGLVEIRWFVGLGAGTSDNQLAIEQKVVRKFNDTHPNIKLTLQVVGYDLAREELATQFRRGTGPDIVGPMGWMASNIYNDQWFDLSALIVNSNYDLTDFKPELVNFYKTDEGQVGLPFAVYPSAVFYNKMLFDNARLAYPPKAYGEPYLMPDGSQAEWNWDTLTNVARLLTLDAQGRNATDTAFDADHIIQYGFVPQYQAPTHLATFWGANKLYDDQNNAVIPPAWATAWEWYYNGMWGDRPFIPNQPAINTPRFGNGNPFGSANIAMAIAQSWYIGPDLAGGQRWDFGALPSYEGVVHGRVDADTFRIWKGTQHPREAFEVLTYFLGPASTDLLRAYGGVPARTADQDAFFAARAQQFPFIKNWDVLKAGLDYPDSPSAEGYMPNFTDAWNRLRSFGDLMGTNDTISISAEIEALRRDLENIFKR